MKCENPVIYKFCGMKENGKQNLKFLGHMSDFQNTGYDKHFDDSVWCKLNNYVIVPCQRCMPCRLNYKKQWADRLILASEEVRYKYFITLTYSEETICETEVQMYNLDDELVIGHSLVKDHVQRFLKRLRKYAVKYKLIDGDHIQYYLCGEYGDLNDRPHYHLILFNFIINDLEHEYSKDGYDYFQSKLLTDLWSFGRTQVCNISYDTCAYVTGYVTKKVYGKNAAEEYVNRAVIPEFCLMSRNPAIGRDIFDKNKNRIYENDRLLLLRGDKVYKIKPIRYFDKLFDIYDHDEMTKIKACRSSHSVELHTDKYGYNYLQTLSKNIKSKQKSKKGGF